ncbi:hypothetical protein HAX54_048962, partial [Datura stramonium]|nr:hypothetical protein [Datura stramonium]
RDRGRFGGGGALKGKCTRCFHGGGSDIWSEISIRESSTCEEEKAMVVPGIEKEKRGSDLGFIRHSRE